MNFLGLDIGTQGVRGIICDDRGNIKSESQSHFNEINISSKPDFKEQNPQNWIDSVISVINNCVLKLNGEKIDGLSLDATSGTILALDKNMEPLTNGIMYNDSRSKVEAETVRMAANEHQKKHGYVFNASYALPKILWIKENQPEIYDRTSLFIHQSDYIYGFLTGNYRISDYSNALKTGYDLMDESWGNYINNLIDVEKLPEVVSPGTKIGTITQKAAEILGLSVNTPVYAGATDGYASSLAAGLARPGQWATVIGTTMVLKGITNKLITDSQGRIYSHKHPQGWWLPGGASNVGGQYLNQITDKSNFEELNKSVSKSGATGEICYPLITQGERFPFVSANACGFYSGSPEIESHYRAAMEGVGYTERLSYELLEELGCEVANDIFTSGGACKSDEWLQIRANILNKKLAVPESTDAAMGSAMIAAAGTLETKLDDAVSNMVHIIKVVEPQDNMLSEYDEIYTDFKDELKKRGYI